jgi:acyl dehydratase
MHAGDSFERRVRWTRADIMQFARDVGDTNPLHHDAEYAAGTRFGDLIASGTQTVAFLMALCGAQAQLDRPGVGLEFSFKLLGPARPDEEILMRWTVVSVEASEKPRGTLVKLTGEALGEGTRPIITAAATTLFVDAL